jgi:predicted transcriptional regulator of viral defense system
MRTPQEELVDTTKLERTLIDIVVRPVYAGGPHEVVRAYETAASRISMNTLIATLKKLDYVYPYHQAIGFLLQKVGVPETQLAKLEALGLEWDFYLAHQISDPLYDSRWRLFYPQSL